MFQTNLFVSVDWQLILRFYMDRIFSYFYSYELPDFFLHTVYRIFHRLWNIINQPILPFIRSIFLLMACFFCITIFQVELCLLAQIFQVLSQVLAYGFQVLREGLSFSVDGVANRFSSRCLKIFSQSLTFLAFASIPISLIVRFTILYTRKKKCF